MRSKSQGATFKSKIRVFSRLHGAHGQQWREHVSLRFTHPGVEIESSSVRVHLSVTGFRCGRQIRTFSYGLIPVVGASPFVQSVQQGSWCLQSRCAGLLLLLLRKDYSPLEAS